jgi:GTP-binding protein
VQIAEWGENSFLVIDTGGILPFGELDLLSASVSAIARDAIEDADLVIFVTDVRTAITAEDEALARDLRALDRPVLLAVNKADAEHHRLDAWLFHRLGIGDPFPISALHGDGVADLLDRVNDQLPMRQAIAEHDDLRLALVGRPNVGKSSLLNALVGAERALVSEIAGTTRDAIDTRLRWHGREIRLVDTAGIRRRVRHEKGVEYFSVLRSIQAIQRCDVAVLLLDAEDGFVAQDSKVAAEIHDAGRGCVIAINKWDRVAKEDKTYLEYERSVREELAFLSYAPIITISATKRQRIGRVLELGWKVGQERQKTVETSRVNDILAKALRRRPPAAVRGSVGKLYYATQTGTAPPAFTLFVNRPEAFPRHTVRYLNNQLRAEFGFIGTRIHLHLRKRQ